MRLITTRCLPSHRQWRLLAGCAVLPCSLAAEAITDTVTFTDDMMPFLTTYVTGDLAPLAINFVFEPGAALDQALLINTPNVAVTAGIGSSISAPSTMNFALQFQNTGGSLNANGMSLTSRNNSGTSRGALVFTQAGTAVLNNSTITALAINTSAALFEAGGSLTMTGGSLNYSPASAVGFEGYALRGTSGTMQVSLENVTLGGTLASSRNFGISLTGNGSLALNGTTTVTGRILPAVNLNGQYTVTSNAALKSLDGSGNPFGNTVRLAGGPTNFTNSAIGSITAGNAAAFHLDASATGSKLTNSGRIDGVESLIVATAVSDFEIINSGPIATTGFVFPISIRGGKITNQAGGTVSGSTSAIAILSTTGPLDVNNSGTISGQFGIHNSAAGVFTFLNATGSTISGVSTGGGIQSGILGQSSNDGGSLTNRGTIIGNKGVFITGGLPVQSSAFTIVNSGEIIGTQTSGLEIISGSSLTLIRDVSIINEVGGSIQGGLVAPFNFSPRNSALYANNSGSGDIEIHNYGTIDPRSQPLAISVEVAESTQATITLHEGSSTLGIIYGRSSGLNAGVTLAFSGSGTHSRNIIDIGTLRKADPGSWTFSGERAGGSVELSAGELILTNRIQSSGRQVNVTNGTLLVASALQTNPGQLNLNNNNLNIGVDGVLILTPNSRAGFGGNAPVMTIHNGGRLQVNGFAGFNNNANFACVVESNGRFAGEGSMVGFVRFQSGGALEIGDGTLGDAGDFALVTMNGTSGLAFGNGGVFRWSLAAFSSANPGVNFDQLILNNFDSVTFQPGAGFDLDLSAIGDIPDPLETVNPFWNSNHTWPFIVGGIVTTPGNLTFTATGQATYPVSGVGTFSFSPDGRSLIWTAGPVTDPFAAWIDSFPTLTDPLKKTKTADADGDGVVNLIEFALNGDPSNPANSGKSRGLVSEISGSRYFSLTLPVRAGAVFSGPGDLVSGPVSSLIYRIQGSFNLTDFTTADLVEVIPALDAGLPALSSNAWRYRTFRLTNPVTTDYRGFIRVGIQAAP